MLPETWQKVVVGILTIYMLAEMVVGYQYNSLALQSDSYHNMTDIVTWIVDLYGRKLASLEPSDGFTYGLARSRFLADLVNAVTLIALCFVVALEAIPRLYSEEIVEAPLLVLIVGCSGLLWNLILTFALWGHGQTELKRRKVADLEKQGKSHSHSHHHVHGHNCNHGLDQVSPLVHHNAHKNNTIQLATSYAKSLKGIFSHSHGRGGCGHDHGEDPKSDDSEDEHPLEPPMPHNHDESDHNDFRSLLNHAKNDMGVTVCVIVSSLITFMFGRPSPEGASWIYKSGIMGTNSSAVSYADPIGAFLVVFFLTRDSFTLALSCAYALLQGINPAYTRRLRNRLYRKVPYLARTKTGEPMILDLHVWKMGDTDKIASVKLGVEVPLQDVQTLEEVRQLTLDVFAEYGISPASVTIELFSPSALEYLESRRRRGFKGLEAKDRPIRPKNYSKPREMVERRDRGSLVSYTGERRPRSVSPEVPPLPPPKKTCCGGHGHNHIHRHGGDSHNVFPATGSREDISSDETSDLVPAPLRTSQSGKFVEEELLDGGNFPKPLRGATARKRPSQRENVQSSEEDNEIFRPSVQKCAHGCTHHHHTERRTPSTINEEKNEMSMSRRWTRRRYVSDSDSDDDERRQLVSL